MRHGLSLHLMVATRFLLGLPRGLHLAIGKLSFSRVISTRRGPVGREGNRVLHHFGLVNIGQ